MEQFKLNQVRKPEQVERAAENELAETQLEEIETALSESFGYKPQADGSHLVLDSKLTSDLKTRYQDFLRAHPAMLDAVLMRTRESTEPLQIQLNRLASEAAAVSASQGQDEQAA